MTATEWDLITHFKPGEIVCPCCKTERMDFTFMTKLDLARDAFGRPIHVTSAYRCVKHNAEVGGSSTSSHLNGRAADLGDRRDPVYRAALYRALQIAGFEQVEFSRDGHLHVMDDPAKPSPFIGVEP